ncbi:hypothetical protein RI054_16g76650 [Pseudoscourfieldia marina]
MRKKHRSAWAKLTESVPRHAGGVPRERVASSHAHPGRRKPRGKFRPLRERSQAESGLRISRMGNLITRQVLPDVPTTVSPESLRRKGWTHVPLQTTFLAISPDYACNLFVVFCHGNSEDIGSALKYHECAREPLGACTIGFEYAGYGSLREKVASETSLVENAKKACKHAEKISRRAEKPLVMSGRSLGCALAITGAILLDKRCAAVILQSPFVNIKYTAEKVLFEGRVRIGRGKEPRHGWIRTSPAANVYNKSKMRTRYQASSSTPRCRKASTQWRRRNTTCRSARRRLTS